MEKITHYQEIICNLLQEYANIKKSITPDVKKQLIIDKENHQYQLLSVGWHRGHFIYTIAFHFSIIDGKVWVQQNNTEALVADELVERGIPKTDIVLGFLSKEARAYSGFAVV